jgi:hypothetical protein
LPSSGRRGRSPSSFRAWAIPSPAASSRGYVTGFAGFEATLRGKWLELLSEIAPGLKRAGIIFNPDTFPTSALIPSLERAARSLKVAPITAPVHSDAEIETAIIAVGREPGGGLVVMGDVFMITPSRVDHIGGGPKQRSSRRNEHIGPVIVSRVAETVQRQHLNGIADAARADCSVQTTAQAAPGRKGASGTSAEGAPALGQSRRIKLGNERVQTSLMMSSG